MVYEQQLEAGISEALRNGKTQIEVLTIQNVATGGHLLNNQRERDAEAYTRAVGQAMFAAKQTYNAEVTGIFASNASRTYTESALSAAAKNQRVVDHAVFVTGRATDESTRDACSVTPSCTILLSKGDWPAIDRIANTGVAVGTAESSGYQLIRQELGDTFDVRENTRLIYIERPGIHVWWRWPDLSSHARSMYQEEKIKVKEYIGNGKWTDWYPMTDASLLKESERSKRDSEILAWQRNQNIVKNETLKTGNNQPGSTASIDSELAALRARLKAASDTYSPALQRSFACQATCNIKVPQCAISCAKESNAIGEEISRLLSQADQLQVKLNKLRPINN